MKISKPSGENTKPILTNWNAASGPSPKAGQRCSRHRFKVEGLLFEFEATTGGPVKFRVIGGATPIKPYTEGSWLAWDDELAPFNEGGYFRSGFPVLRQVASLTTEWVLREKPYSFHFEATDRRKHEIYRRLVARHGMLADQPYMHYISGPQFFFVRRAA
ncbi:hypothetical protein [Mesorhizobium sp. B2-6-1]|uniref:hypothetical protein n=1 Tax=Mesorhizobium sp. B2-6-1 TaxID=2589916 RepID=UPI001128DA80|nr:hypothetical protein [Mesorhizobium sp. B2-6-1]TPJ58660.1 hypothetical protein FJ443_25455 [Mesorhizobium sp. B2-6-1]